MQSIPPAGSLEPPRLTNQLDAHARAEPGGYEPEPLLGHVWLDTPGKTLHVWAENLEFRGGTDRFAGEDPGPELEVYNPVTNSWATKTPLPYGTAEGAAVGAAGKVYYIVGRAYPVTGGESNLLVSELYAYTP